MTKLDSFLESLLQELKADREALAKMPKTHRLWCKYPTGYIDFVDHHSLEFSESVKTFCSRHDSKIDNETEYRIALINDPCPFE